MKLLKLYGLNYFVNRAVFIEQTKKEKLPKWKDLQESLKTEPLLVGLGVSVIPPLISST